jgi:predicted DNA-binding protein
MSEGHVHVRLDETGYHRVAALAQARGTSVAAVMREAIDRGRPAAAH